MPEIQDYRCASWPTAPGGYRVTAIVDGIAVTGWVNVYTPVLTPSLTASLITVAERAIA